MRNLLKVSETIKQLKGGEIIGKVYFKSRQGPVAIHA